MWELINSDVYRWEGKSGLLPFFKAFIKNKGFRFSFFLRLCKGTKKIPLINIITIIFYKIAKLVYTTDVNYKCNLGPGFRIHHVFGTTWSDKVVIGANATIVHNVTIAGKNNKWPVIGDNVYIGTGACILGDIKIGNNVVIGANCVVTKDIEDNSIVAGNPGKVISTKGSASLILNPVKVK